MCIPGHCTIIEEVHLIWRDLVIKDIIHHNGKHSEVDGNDIVGEYLHYFSIEHREPKGDQAQA